MKRLPMKWKLTIWSAMMLLLMFCTYNAVQYFYIEKWIMKQAESSVQRNMHEVLNYLLERESTLDANNLLQLRSSLGRINQNNQLIRIMDEQGHQLLAVSNNIPEQWAQAAAEIVQELSHVRHNNQSLIIMRSPITIFEFNGTVEIVKSMDEFNRLRAAYSKVMIGFGLIAVLLFGIGGGFLAWQLLKPLQVLASTIQSIRSNGLQERVPISRSEDEITALMKLFNDMMDEVQRSFAQQRQFVEDASHELRTPIAIVEGHLALLQRWGKHDPAVMEESLQAAMQELTRLKGLTQELLALARADQALALHEASQTVMLQRSINEVVNRLAAIHPDFQFRTELQSLAQAEAAIYMAPGHLQQILLIILDNAIKYSGTSKLVVVRGWTEDEMAQIEIIDYGVGIAEQELPLVTDRFYRVDKARTRDQSGYGLGLAISKRLVGRYDGKLVIQSKLGAGTRVRVSLKLAAD